MELTLESLGMTQKELQDRVVRMVADSVLHYDSEDEDGYMCEHATTFAKELQKHVRDRLDAAVAQIAEGVVIPDIGTYIEALDFQATNTWGEGKGEKITFREYLASRAESYLTEKVDYQGKSLREAGGCSWSGTQTRICHLVHQHLHHEIERIMAGAVKSANEAITEGIAETVKIKLKEIAAGLKVAVTTK